MSALHGVDGVSSGEGESFEDSRYPMNSVSSGSFECLEHVQLLKYSLFTLSRSYDDLNFITIDLLGLGSILVTLFNLGVFESDQPC